jgi:hypothetical protein
MLWELMIVLFNKQQPSIIISYPYMQTLLINSINIQQCYRIKAHEEREQTSSAPSTSREGAVPAYLLDREQQTHGKLLSSMIKQKRKEKAGYVFMLIWFDILIDLFTANGKYRLIKSRH